MDSSQDREVRLYQSLMDVPDRFSSGFGWKTVFGALFLGLAMLPGSIYLSLVMGQGLGPAARWVTVILFAEVARRSMKSLKQQEIFIIFYMAGIALGGQLHGGIMTQLLWNQYLVQAPAVSSMGLDVPSWVAPSDPAVLDRRTFYQRPWLVPVFFLAGMFVIQRIDAFGLGYALYRWTSHVEKLAFPMAPADALGMSALAETEDRSERWKWRCFSLGGVIGIVFGAVYIGLPAVTAAVFGKPVSIIPIPFLDLTSTISSKQFMPATPVNLVFDLGLVIMGMVLPFWAVVGGFLGLLITLALNPLLYRGGLLTTWVPGMRLVDTMFSNHVDFYLSFGIGLALAIFLISLGQIVRPLWRKLRGPGHADDDAAERKSLVESVRSLFVRNRERGDMSILIALGIYVFSTIGYIIVCMILMPGDPETGIGRFPWRFFLGFAFIYTPVMSYVNAKLEGMVGQTVQIPLVREASFILSGYSGSAIWFAPIPINDYGMSVRQFRVMELTGTRLSGLIRTELLVIPVVLVTSIVFSDAIWRLAEIPSPAYPYAQELWELNALNFSLTATATLDGSSRFIEALKPQVIGWGAGFGLIAFGLLSFLGLPTFLIYGMVRGLGQITPGNILPEMIGALIGRFYLQRIFGEENYKKYVMVVLAGFTAGMGLVGMASVAFALIAKSTSTLRY
ncbi:MAG: peptide transporter [Phycisphaeraceae bacterium]|nr:peptide transporter [Phycisphaeraceae bacterium]